MPDVYNHFFELLRFALGTSDICPRIHLHEWQAVYQIAKKQTLTAFIGSALGKVKDDVLVENDADSREAFEDLMMEWTGEVVKTVRRNRKLNKDVIEEFQLLEGKGLECCLLKGQGNALLYPNPDARTPGDIDVWVRLKGKEITDHNIRQITRMVKRVKPDAKASYHHIDAPDMNGTPVEIHYRPHFLMSFLYNRRLQEYFRTHADSQFSHKVSLEDGKEIAVPTPEFNVIFQLSHIFNHLTHEGIGMRHIVDYYYVLQKLWEKPVDKDGLAKKLRSVGLYSFAASIMWILVEVLGMDKALAIVIPDKKCGRFVLQEILQGGNFGKFDDRSEVKYLDSPVKVQLRHIMRNLHMLQYFPGEALVEPFARGFFFFLRKRMNRY